MEHRHRVSASTLLAVLAGAALSLLGPGFRTSYDGAPASTTLAFTGAATWPTAPPVESVVAMRVSPYYTNEDRERLARQRKETRLARRRAPPVTQTLNYDNLPPIEDIYARKYSGNATADPIGGRKRYTMFVMFKATGGRSEQEKLRESIQEYISFMKTKMSCREIHAAIRKSPIDGEAVVKLEYPMKEYGEVQRGKTTKEMYDKARMVEFNFFAPVAAIEYIKKRMYADNGIFRLLVLGHTRTFKHAGEDNELHL